MTERTPLLNRGREGKHNRFSGRRLSKTGRSASIGALGGSASLGTFEFKERPHGHTRANSDGLPSSLTPTELGRQELYRQVPFTAVFGLQKKGRTISQVFASYAADMDTFDLKDITPEERENRRSRTSMIVLDELEFDANVVTAPLVFAIIVAVASQFLVGYNTGVMNAPEKVVFPDHSTTKWSLAVAAFAIGGPFGAVIGGQMADKRGRRGALLIDMWLFLVGGLIQTFAMDMSTITIARFIIGFASGYSSVLVPILLGELAPPTLRGMLGTLTQFALVTGILVADLLSFPFASARGWRVLFAVTPLTAMAQLFMSTFLLESPRWLLSRNPESLKARYIIKQLRGLRYDHEVEAEVENFVGGTVKQSEQQSQSALLKEMMGHSKIRVLFISCLVLQMAQQLSGSNAVFYYSTSFFDGVISDPLIGTTLVGAVNVLATYGALLLMDSCGRKTLILWSSAGMFVACVVIMLSLLKVFNNIMALVAVNVYIMFFEIGLGPIPWLIVAEMFESKYVSVAMSISCQLNWVCNFIVSFAFPFMAKYLGPFSFAPFALILLFTFIFAVLVLPETQGTTPEELAAELVRRNSANMTYKPNAATAGSTDEQWKQVMERLMQEEQAENGTFGKDV